MRINHNRISKKKRPPFWEWRSLIGVPGQTIRVQAVHHCCGCPSGSRRNYFLAGASFGGAGASSTALAGAAAAGAAAAGAGAALQQLGAALQQLAAGLQQAGAGAALQQVGAGAGVQQVGAAWQAGAAGAAWHGAATWQHLTVFTLTVLHLTGFGQQSLASAPLTNTKPANNADNANNRLISFSFSDKTFPNCGDRSVPKMQNRPSCLAGRDRGIPQALRIRDYASVPRERQTSQMRHFREIWRTN